MVILFSRLSLFPFAGSQSTDMAFHDYLNKLGSSLGLISYASSSCNLRFDLIHFSIISSFKYWCEFCMRNTAKVFRCFLSPRPILSCKECQVKFSRCQQNTRIGSLLEVLLSVVPAQRFRTLWQLELQNDSLFEILQRRPSSERGVLLLDL